MFFKIRVFIRPLFQVPANSNLSSEGGGGVGGAWDLQLPDPVRKSVKFSFTKPIN